MAEIRKWHEEERRAGIKRAFELGDLILKAVIHTGLTEWEIINRIRDDLGDLALGTSSYNRAARMARVFTKRQRAVLIDRMVSLEKAEILAGQHYDGRPRTVIIDRIKCGKMKAPWTFIRGAHADQQPTRRGVEVKLPEDSSSNVDSIVVPVVRGGEVDEDQVLNVFKNLITRLGAPRAMKLWEQAVREAAKTERGGAACAG
jgi:hypothetical protein